MFQVQIGNAYYTCSCVRYVITENSLWLIVGLSAGCAILLIIIIVIIIVLVCRRRRSKQCEESNNGAGSVELHEDNGNYNIIPADKTEHSAGAYTSLGPADENRQYSALGLPNTNTNTATYDLPYMELNENMYTALR